MNTAFEVEDLSGHKTYRAQGRISWPFRNGTLVARELMLSASLEAGQLEEVELRLRLEPQSRDWLQTFIPLIQPHTETYAFKLKPALLTQHHSSLLEAMSLADWLSVADQLCANLDNYDCTGSSWIPISTRQTT